MLTHTHMPVFRVQAAHVEGDSLLFDWAYRRASSAYHSGVGGEWADGLGGGSVPMLPTELAHGSLSLNQGQRRSALSLFLEVHPASASHSASHSA